MNLTKWSPSVPPIVIGIVTAATPAIQEWMAQHPVIMTALGVAYMVLSLVLPSPVRDQPKA